MRKLVIRFASTACGILFAAGSTAVYAESALDVSPICTLVFEEQSKKTLISRSSHCHRSRPMDYAVIGDNNVQIGLVRIHAYAYSENQTNQTDWHVKFRFRTTVLSGSGDGLKIRPEVSCGANCEPGESAGAMLVPGGLSQEVDINLRINLEQMPNRILDFSPIPVYYRIAKTSVAIENGDSLGPHGYIPDLKCDYGVAKAGTEGCVYVEAPAVFRTVKTNDPAVDESALHIKDAQADGLPGKFIPANDGTIHAASGVRGLTRTKDAEKRRKNRAESKRQCIAIYGSVTGECTFTGDPDEVQTNCDCDEYPFASTNQGAYTNQVSVRRINASDNRSAGGRLGAFYASQRVLDGGEFFVDVEP